MQEKRAEARRKGRQQKWFFLMYATIESLGERKLAADVMLEELEILALQKCAICAGFGHAMSDCPTNGRLENYKAVPATGNVITAYRKFLRQRNAGNAPTVVSMLRPAVSKKCKINIPALGGGNRSRQNGTAETSD